MPLHVTLNYVYITLQKVFNGLPVLYFMLYAANTIWLP